MSRNNREKHTDLHGRRQRLAITMEAQTREIARGMAHEDTRTSFSNFIEWLVIEERKRRNLMQIADKETA